MRIRRVDIKNRVKVKVLYKHGIYDEEIYSVFEINPFIIKSRNDCYMAIGCPNRFITVIFRFRNGIVKVITAYSSSKGQIRMYKRK